MSIKVSTNNLEIEKLDHFGRGITRVNNVPVFFFFCVVGDIIDIDIVKSKKNYMEGVIKKFIKKSSKRVNNPCIYNDRCGGCNLLNISHEEALIFKENRLKEILSKFKLDNIKINNIEYSNNFNYRNKITLHINNKKIGLYEKRTNDIVEINKCLLVSDDINTYIDKISKFIKNNNHNLKEVMIRSFNKNIVLSFKGKVDKELLKSYFSEVHSMYLNNELISGEKDLIVDLCNYKFRVSHNSFFQVNLEIAEKMFNKVTSYIKEKNIKNVLDLYCGVGVIGILMSKYVKEVTGIEVVEDAIKNANYNKELNDIHNINFICGKTEEYIDRFISIDLIVVDPPRSGLDKKAIDNILRIKPKELIYVSCDNMTLGRDIRLLNDNYHIKELTPFDMFPNTYHVECVCILERR